MTEIQSFEKRKSAIIREVRYLYARSTTPSGSTMLFLINIYGEKVKLLEPSCHKLSK